MSGAPAFGPGSSTSLYVFQKKCMYWLTRPVGYTMSPSATSASGFSSPIQYATAFCASLPFARSPTSASRTGLSALARVRKPASRTTASPSFTRYRTSASSGRSGSLAVYLK